METRELVLWILFIIYCVYVFVPLFLFAVIAIIGVFTVQHIPTPPPIPPPDSSGSDMPGINSIGLSDRQLIIGRNGEMQLQLVQNADKFPSVVAVQSNATGSWQVSCFGAAIRPDWVMTSAHCRTDGAHHQVVLLKTRQVTDNGTRRVLTWHVHERYNARDADGKYDIALAQLDVQSHEPPLMTSIIGDQPVTSAVACIWRTLPKKERRSMLNHTLDSFRLDSFNQTVCRSTYNISLDESLICANLSGYKHCLRREFGPLFNENKLLGLLALGPSSCKIKAAVFTNVSYFSTWILSIIG